MKPVYTDLNYNQDIHIAGITSMQIIPREWLASDPVIDFDTGQILIAPTLLANKFWLQVSLTQRSYDFQENPKNTKSGDYYEITASGLLNTYNFAMQRALETIRYSELVAVLKDKNKRRKFIGTSAAAMKLTITHSQKNASSEETVLLSLAAQCEEMPPFYNPDNTPDILGDFLIDSDGNYLLVS